MFPDRLSKGHGRSERPITAGQRPDRHVRRGPLSAISVPRFRAIYPPPFTAEVTGFGNVSTHLGGGAWGTYRSLTADTGLGGESRADACAARASSDFAMPSSSCAARRLPSIAGAYVDDRAGRITFAEWAEHYFAIAGKRLARTSYARDIDYVNNHVLPRWGTTPLARITKPAVEPWVVDLAEPGARASGAGTLAPGSIEKIYQTFRKVMAAAVDDDRIPKLPCPTRPPLPRGKRKPVRFLTGAEVTTLAAAIEARYEAGIYLLAYGGFPIGRVCRPVDRGCRLGSLVRAGAARPYRRGRRPRVRGSEDDSIVPDRPDGRSRPGEATGAHRHLCQQRR